MDDVLKRIQEYYDGDMSVEDRSVFEADLKTDRELKVAVEEYKLMVQSIEKTGMLDVLNAVDLTDSDKPGKDSSVFKWMGLIAVLAAVIALIYFVSNGDAETSPPVEQTTIQFADQMPALDGLPVTLSDDGGMTSEAMIAYRMKDYAKARQLFGTLIDKGFRSDTIIIYQANALVELSKYEEAIQLLSPMTLNANSNYYYDALWYQGKAYLLNDQIDEAMQVLNLLIKEENPYQVKAKELVKMLNY